MWVVRGRGRGSRLAAGRANPSEEGHAGVGQAGCIGVSVDWWRGLSGWLAAPCPFSGHAAPGLGPLPLSSLSPCALLQESTTALCCSPCSPTAPTLWPSGPPAMSMPTRWVLRDRVTCRLFGCVSWECPVGSLAERAQAHLWQDHCCEPVGWHPSSSPLESWRRLSGCRARTARAEVGHSNSGPPPGCRQWSS